jgi:hypothetical protein
MKDKEIFCTLTSLFLVRLNVAKKIVRIRVDKKSFVAKYHVYELPKDQKIAWQAQISYKKEIFSPNSLISLFLHWILLKAQLNEKKKEVSKNKSSLFTKPPQISL